MAACRRRQPIPISISQNSRDSNRLFGAGQPFFVGRRFGCRSLLNLGSSGFLRAAGGRVEGDQGEADATALKRESRYQGFLDSGIGRDAVAVDPMKAGIERFSGFGQVLSQSGFVTQLETFLLQGFQLPKRFVLAGSLGGLLEQEQFVEDAYQSFQPLPVAALESVPFLLQLVQLPIVRFLQYGFQSVFSGLDECGNGRGRLRGRAAIAAPLFGCVGDEFGDFFDALHFGESRIEILGIDLPRFPKGFQNEGQEVDQDARDECEQGQGQDPGFRAVIEKNQEAAGGNEQRQAAGDERPFFDFRISGFGTHLFRIYRERTEIQAVLPGSAE